MKRLTLSQSNKKIAGVCGGLGEYFDLDPTLIRLIVVILALATALVPMMIGYLLAWIIVPRTPSS